MEATNKRRTGCLQREKNGTWVARVSVRGRTYARTTATKDLERARQFLAGFVAAVERAHPAEPDPGPLLDEWPRYESSPAAARLTAAGRTNRYRAWRRFSTWMRATHPEVADAAGVTHRMADEYIDFFGRGRASMTQNLCISALRDIFRVLCDAHGVDANPWGCVPARFGDTYARRELSDDEVRRLVAAADAAGGEWPRLFALAVYTGLRLGDCCRLTWESVDLAQGLIQVVPHKTRRYAAGRPVTIPVHAQLMAALVATPPAGRRGFVLPALAEDYARRRWRISKALARIFDGAGIVRSVLYEGRTRLTPRATFHSLRHSFVSFAANAGVPLPVVQSIVGHSSTAMTRHYYHANESALRQAVNAIPSFGTACAGARARPARSARSARPPTVVQRLERANKLLARGLVSEAEHAALRARILADV